MGNDQQVKNVLLGKAILITTVIANYMHTNNSGNITFKNDVQFTDHRTLYMYGSCS